MSNDSTLILGAVAYDPKVVTIWEGFRRYFIRQGLDFDFVLYSNYERQVGALFSGHIHVAWNSPLAWVESKELAKVTGRSVSAICMRDTDVALASVILVPTDSRIHNLPDLKGTRIACGAFDSPQATLIPMSYLADNGLNPGEDFEIVPFNLLVGLHGDHVGGEREAVRAALRGDADAACVKEGNFHVFSEEGTIPEAAMRIVARTRTYDHCNFTVIDGAPIEQVNRFRDLLLRMPSSDEEVQRLFRMEGLKEWVPGRSDGYAELTKAVHRFKTIDPFVKSVTGQAGASTA